MQLTYPAIFYEGESGFVSMLVLGMDAYAEAKHINFSKVLQDSLTSIYQQEIAAS